MSRYEGVDVPEGIWRLSLTLTTADGRRFRARRVVGRTAAQTGVGVDEHVVIGSTARSAAWETAAKTHEAEALLMKIMGRPDEERRHLIAAKALAQEARFHRALATSRAATPEETTHDGHVHFDPACRLCHQRLDVVVGE